MSSVFITCVLCFSVSLGSFMFVCCFVLMRTVRVGTCTGSHSVFPQLLQCDDESDRPADTNGLSVGNS